MQKKKKATGKKVKKPARKALNESIKKSQKRSSTVTRIEKGTDTNEPMITDKNISKYGFVKKNVYRRRGNFLLDTENYQVALVRCTNGIDYNVELFDKNTEDDGIFIKTISKEAELVELLTALSEKQK